jgi:uncharacterized protein (DUF1330 family)
MSANPHELNEALIRNLPDQGPVVMVNMLRFREVSADGDGTGWDAYLRYSRMVMPLIKARGGGVVWAGRGEGVAFGNAAEAGWDYVVLVHYPSRAAFLDMTTSAEYAAANVHRENGVARHVIVAASQTFPG